MHDDILGGRNNVLSEDERGGAGTSDDEVLSDSESSVASLTDRKKSFEQVSTQITEHPSYLPDVN